MALHKKGKFYYGDSQADIRNELLRYSKSGYLAEHYADAICSCGGKLFHLQLDDEAGAAIRTCVSCGSQHPIGDSAEYLDEAEPEECQCICGSEVFEITAGIALYEQSEDVKWLYIGCRCSECGLTACFGDWKNEFSGYQDFLQRI